MDDQSRHSVFLFWDRITLSGNNPLERWMAQLDMVPAAIPGNCSRYVGFSSLGPGHGGQVGPMEGNAVYHSLSRWQPSLASISRRLATRRGATMDNFRLGNMHSESSELHPRIGYPSLRSSSPIDHNVN